MEDAFGLSGEVGASDCKGETARVSEESGGCDGDSGDERGPVEECEGMLGVVGGDVMVRGKGAAGRLQTILGLAEKAMENIVLELFHSQDALGYISANHFRGLTFTAPIAFLTQAQPFLKTMDFWKQRCSPSD